MFYEGRAVITSAVSKLRHATQIHLLFDHLPPLLLVQQEAIPGRDPIGERLHADALDPEDIGVTEPLQELGGRRGRAHDVAWPGRDQTPQAGVGGQGPNDAVEISSGDGLHEPLRCFVSIVCVAGMLGRRGMSIRGATRPA
jgi:hypothetical protein